jgi:transcriptional regulator with XRE-family HTH domain
MSLVQIILEGRKEDFAKKFSNKFTEEQLRAIIDKSDVLPGQHKYLNFLGKVVNPRNFNSDLNIVVKLLEKFSTISQNLNLKDINQYDKISTLKKELDDYDNRIRREIKTVDDADVVYEDNEMTVVSPKTHKSSCYFGSGTKWCTAASDSGHYDRYNQDGKLFYFVSKTKPTSDPTYKVALLKKFDGTETYYNAPDDSFRTGWIFGTEKLEKILSRINSYISTTFADQLKIWNDKELAEKERQRLNREANERAQRQQLERAEQRRQTNEWDLEDTDDIGLRANALFKYLVSIDNLQELTPEIKARIVAAERELAQYQEQYDSQENADEDTDLVDNIAALEVELDEYKELTDVYTLLPAQYGHHGLTQFENILDGTEWAVGDESEMEQASRESVESLLDDLGIGGFNRSFVENYVNEDAVEGYIRDFFNHDVYDSPESYLSDDDKEISSSQKQEIAELRQEEIELDTERNELNSDDFEEDYIEQRTSEIEIRLLEIQDEIEEINNNPDGDYDEDAIEKVIDDRVSDYTSDLESFVSDFLGTDYFEWIVDNDLIDKNGLIEGVVESDGYGVSLSSYDGDVNEEVVDGRTYYIIRVS